MDLRSSILECWSVLAEVRMYAPEGVLGRNSFWRMHEDNRNDQYMAEALDLARQALGRTSPNPVVGAVVVRGGRIVGRGYHPQAGAPHAEIFALQEAGPLSRRATLYLTLEPCCHWGRTGPCTQAILEAGIGSVVVATEDPDPRVNGSGVARLREAGVEVTVGVLREAAEALNAAYLKHRRTGLPFITLKWAMSVDGKITARSGTRARLTGEEAQRFVHELRNVHDAILVGINTVLVDDPQLTCRIPGGRDPLRVILDSRLRLPLDARILNLSSPARTLVVTSTTASAERVSSLRAKGADVLVFDGPRPPMRWVCEQLAAQGVLSVLVEGGAAVHAAALDARLADRLVAVIAPLILGGEHTPSPVAGSGVEAVQPAVVLRGLTVRRLGEDLVVEGTLRYPVRSQAQEASAARAGDA